MCTFNVNCLTLLNKSTFEGQANPNRIVVWTFWNTVLDYRGHVRVCRSKHTFFFVSLNVH